MSKKLKKATKIKDLSIHNPFLVKQSLYKLNPPLDGKDFVVVSASSSFINEEVYIFPSNETGKILSFIELEGSYKGGLDHEKALNNMGYSLY